MGSTSVARAARRELSEGERARAKLSADLRAARVDRRYYKRRVQALSEDLERVTAERDDYQVIAQTHEIKWPDMPDERAWPVWREQRYGHHPARNLATLEADLEPYLEREIRLVMRLDPQGGWARRLRRTEEMVWTGPGARVLEEIRFRLMDLDFKLMVPVKGGQPRWADEDSPLVFSVDLDTIERAPPEIKIQEVQVLRVQPEIRERVVEQPVIIEVPTRPRAAEADAEEDQVGLTRDEVLALFEVELESKLGEFGLRRAPPDLPTAEPARSRAIEQGLPIEKDL